MDEAAVAEMAEIQAPKTSPVMQQYLEMKLAHPDALLFYRMGDFYELFFEDAITAAKELDISLTHRGKHEEERIPMCGVPHHSYEPYLQKLIQLGYKVAICEQMETPEEAKKRGYKAVLRREVVRIVTPGTLVEDSLLKADEANYLVALAMLGGQMACAWIDISTGEFYVSEVTRDGLTSELARLSARELIMPYKLFEADEHRALWKEMGNVITPQADNIFDYLRSEKRLKDFFQVETFEAYGQFSRVAVMACGALIEYVDLTQKGVSPRLSPPKQFSSSHFMAIDAATRRNLELVSSFSGGKKGTLLDVMDEACTHAGGRLLRVMLGAPLACAASIHERLDMVAFFVENEPVRQSLRLILKATPDMERALSRLCIQKGGPKDLLAIRDGLAQTLAMAEVVEFSGTSKPQGIVSYLKGLGVHDAFVSQLTDALEDEVGLLVRDGGFIRAGHHPYLDELRGLRDNSRQSIDALREQYRKETGVNSLKIIQNNVLGWFVEVTPLHAGKVTDEKFVHRQTLAGAVRYTTHELRQLESDILNARDQALKIELQLFETLRAEVIKRADAIAQAAQSIAGLDVMAGFAHTAASRHYTRPQVDESNAFIIEGGRHPVVESLQDGFTPNTCDLSAKQRLWLLTGPNMAGKSTFLRQNALITILAQIGSYVPATRVHMGVVDKVFSRVGASDDLARGRSTFMVEMVETATILNQATEKSLVILDEIGRGTATFDGLSIAWAVVEHLHQDIRCRGLFATHYHELTTLAQKLPALACYSMRVREWQGDVVFMHEVVRGAADRSYGIHVARIAGLPKSVTKRADEVLGVLQQSEMGQMKMKLVDDLPLFANVNQSASVVQSQHPVVGKLKNIMVDDLSPREALDLLYDLKRSV